MKASRSIHASTTGILLISLLLIFNASIQFDEVTPSIQWSQPSSAPSRLKFELLNRVALRINQSYMEPERIIPEAMFHKAMHYLELEIPEFVHQRPSENNTITRLTIGSLSLSVDTTKLTSIWQTVFHVSDTLRMLHRSELISGGTRSRLEQIACQGILSTLDAHSMVLSEAALFELKRNTLGRFGGIGIVIASQKQALRIIEVMPGTPAHTAGLKAGDQILEIDKDTTLNLSLNEAAELLRGPMDSVVRLTVRQTKNKRVKRVELKRSKISVNSVAARELEEGIGYLRIDHFQEQTIVEVSQVLQHWKSPIEGLIIDLRRNPGGLLEQAISISDLFLSTGDIVTTVGYQKEPTQVHRATRDTLDEHTPMVILVDEQSASASEIMAAALQDNGRALVFGRPTYGKGSVQVLFEFPNKWGLKITVAQYLTPKSASIQDVGVQPDVLVRGFAPDDDEKNVAAEGVFVKKSNGSGLRFDYLKIKESRDREIEVARSFLVKRAKEMKLNKTFQLETLVEALSKPYRVELEYAFQKAKLSWHTPNCSPKDQTAIRLHIESEQPALLTQEWTPRISIRNQSERAIGALKLAIRSGDITQRVTIGGLDVASALTFEPKLPVKLVSQNGQCLVQVSVEDACGHTQARHDVVLNCTQSPQVHARSNLLFADREMGNGNGVLEFGERGELTLKLITHDTPVIGEIVASLALLGQPKQRLIRLIKGRSTIELDVSSLGPKGTNSTDQLSFQFEIEAKDISTLARSTPQQLLIQVKNADGKHLIYKTINLTLYPSEPTSLMVPTNSKAHLLSKIRTKPEARLHFQPDVRSEVIAETGGQLEVLARRGDWLLVAIDNGFGWLNQADRDHAETQGTVTDSGSTTTLRYSGGGQITFDRRPVVTRHSSFVLKGAFSGFDLKDYRFFHNGKKKVYARIYERSVLGHPFETVFQLTPGMNRVDAILRSKSGFETSRTFFVTRKETRL